MGKERKGYRFGLGAKLNIARLSDVFDWFSRNETFHLTFPSDAFSRI